MRAAGHRVVHGGASYSAPGAWSTTPVLAELEALIPLAPLHQPHNLAPIRALKTVHPDLLQVACFDTAFHRSNPVVAQSVRPAAGADRRRACAATASTACPTNTSPAS